MQPRDKKKKCGRIIQIGNCISLAIYIEKGKTLRQAWGIYHSYGSQGKSRYNREVVVTKNSMRLNPQ